MSVRQRLITRYITRLFPEIITPYRLHLLRIEKDDSAIHMLKEALETTYKETQNYVLGELIREIPKDPNYNKLKFGQHYSKKKKESKQMIDEEAMPGRNQLANDDIQRANQLFHQLEFEDSLILFEKVIKNGRSGVDKFFQKRILCNLALENYREALLISQKAKFHDMAFVSAIASGEFEIAKQYIDKIIKDVIRNSQEGSVVASSFEMIHLVTFVLFATSTSKETYQMTDELFRSTNWGIEELRSITKSFCDRDFKGFIEQMQYLDETFDNSIYTSHSKAKLVEAIIQNALVLFLYPLSKASFIFINDFFKISDKDIIYYVKKSIREGKLNGKLDLVSNMYIASTKYDNNQKDLTQIYNDTLSIRHDFEINLWVHEYNIFRLPAPREDKQ